ncbi:hypothetical protein Tco_0168114 [Tanacetum coccineum]
MMRIQGGDEKERYFHERGNSFSFKFVIEVLVSKCLASNDSEVAVRISVPKSELENLLGILRLWQLQIAVALEKSSTIVRKNLHLFMVGDLYGSQMSIWMSSKGNKAWEVLSGKGDAWFLAKGQTLQVERSELQETEMVVYDDDGA